MTETIIESVQPEMEAAVKPYKFRPLGGEDVFLMFKIIGKIGVKEFNACFENDGITDLVARLMGERMNQADESGETQSVSVTYISDILEVACLLYTSPSPRDRSVSRMPSSA